MWVRYEMPIWEFNLYDHARRVNEGQVCRRVVEIERAVRLGTALTRRTK
jgi:hypothetical protein